MAKYYLQCGPIQTILNAESADQAALTVIDRVLQSHRWIYDDPDLGERHCHDHLMLEALMHLDPTIRISEQGFDRGDAERIGTPETINQWHQLMVGIRRLIIAAGLPPQSTAFEFRDNVPATSTPRSPR